MKTNFTYTYNSDAGNVDISWDIRHPVLNSSVREIAYQIITKFKLPFSAEKDLVKSLEVFVSEGAEDFYNKRSDDNFDGEPIDSLAEQWSALYHEECARYSTSKVEHAPEGPTFAEMYHSLIHSAALETMLNLEHTYALSVEELVHERDEAMIDMQKNQSKEMEEAVGKVGTLYSDQDINDLAARHFHETQELIDSWEKKIGSLKQLQRKEFSEWITKVHEDYKSGCGSPGYVQRVRAMSEFSSPTNADVWQPLQATRMEESFTIHLGSQLKVTHNLRLLSADVLDLCRHKAYKVGGVLFPQPQRLQTAMSLYSNALCGLVLLVDNRINSYTGIKRDFAAVCQQSTELHFPDIEEQLESIRNKSSIHKTEESKPKNSHKNVLRSGDFYVTKHSNLSEVHVVFHLVGDDTLMSSDINSRHPVILGLRNILRVAHERDVSSITLPLLLVQDMAEEMTIPWCLKRAELVFKCIKGFMIEMASLTGEETRTVQFMVPKGISDEFFGNLSTMLPSIFRVSNPLILK